MKTLILQLLLLLVVSSCQNQLSNNSSNLKENKMEQSIEKAEIQNLLFLYRDALNASDVSKVLTLYTNDGVFMPSNGPSAIGTEQIKSSYEFVFKTIQLNIEFFIDEIVVNGEYAFARTVSKGTTLIHANGETVAEENRELFVLQHINGKWKISRYMFNKMK